MELKGIYLTIKQSDGNSGIPVCYKRTLWFAVATHGPDLFGEAHSSIEKIQRQVLIRE